MTLPKTIGAYAIEALVGQGGMGVVYRAKHTKLGRLVALKTMLPSEASDEESVARFLREARLAAALEHPGIVRIYEVGTHEDTPYIAMEWIDGPTLRAAGTADPHELLADVAEILAFAHEHGVVHRDLKPANVMLDAHGRPKLVDFGIAKRVASGTFATRDGVVLGTPRYMAPEQELSSAVDARADQYAWGVMAYELLTGDTPSRPALAHAALDERDGDVIMRALSPSPADRFPTMRDLLAAWSPRPAPRPLRSMPSRPTPRRMRAFVVSLLGAMTAAAIVAAAFLRSPTKQMPVVASTSLPTPIPSASASEAPVELEPPPVPEESASAEVVPPPSTVPRGPRLVQRVVLSSGPFLNVDIENVRAVITPPARAALRRCLVGVPYRERKYGVRVYLKDDGTVESTTADDVRERAPEAWPGRAARACIDGVIMPLKFTVMAGGGFFLLDFDMK